ncbi:MAG: hypothetical protein IT326_10405 [Anaerolineae bacterium]|nr:hypothetical protein [Anaerolineae bacterium]
MSEEFRQTGGARIGASEWFAGNATLPFATLAATPDTISVQVFGKSYLFPRYTITLLSPHRGLLFQGLRIRHNVPGYPPFVVFWTPDYSALVKALEALGYRVGPPA